MSLVTKEQNIAVERLESPELPDTPGSTISVSSAASSITPRVELSKLSIGEPLNKKRKKNNKKNGANLLLKSKPLKPFDYNVPPVFKLADLKYYQFIPREIEMEQFSKTIKLPVKPKNPSPTSSQTVPPIKPIPTGPASERKSGPPTDNANKKEENNSVTVIQQERPKLDPNFEGTRHYWVQLKKYNGFHQARRFVRFVIPIGPTSPKILLFTVKSKFNEYFLPGGALTYNEDEEEGLRRVWNETFKSPNDDQVKDVKFEQVLNTWYRSDYNINVYPYESKFSSTKEIIKVYLVKLPQSGILGFSGFYESLLPVDFHRLYEVSDPQIRNIPLLLSNYKFE